MIIDINPYKLLLPLINLITPAHKYIKIHLDIHLGFEMGTVSEKLISVINLDIDTIRAPL